MSQAIQVVTTVYKDGTYDVYGSNTKSIEELISKVDPNKEVADQFLGVYEVDTSVDLLPGPE